MSIRGTDLQSTTGPLAPRNAPPAQNTGSLTATPAAPVQPKPGDTATLTRGSGVISTPGGVEIDEIVMPQTSAGAQPAAEAVGAEAEADTKAGALLDAFGEKLDNDALKKGGNILNAPQLIIKGAQGVEMLLRDPSKLAKAGQEILDNPFEKGQEAYEAITEIKEGVETVKDGAGAVLGAGKNVVTNIAENGLTAGLAKTGQDIKAAAQGVGAEIKENFSSATGGGLDNLPKALGAEAAETAEKKATQAITRHLEATVPELAPKGVIANATRRVEKLVAPVTDLIDKGLQVADKVADRVADGATKALERSKPGRAVVATVKKMHPHHGVPQGVLKKAVSEGTETGVKAAVESGTAALAKKGIRPTPAAVKAMTEVGQAAAGKATARAATRAVGKGLARFAPGVNVAIAAMDVHHAAKVMRDPKATRWQKGMAGATAALSVVSATNIPVVSQIAAGASIVTGVLENIKPASIRNAASAAAAKLKFW